MKSKTEKLASNDNGAEEELIGRAGSDEAVDKALVAGDQRRTGQHSGYEKHDSSAIAVDIPR